MASFFIAEDTVNPSNTQHARTQLTDVVTVKQNTRDQESRMQCIITHCTMKQDSRGYHSGAERNTIHWARWDISGHRTEHNVTYSSVRCAAVRKQHTPQHTTAAARQNNIIQHTLHTAHFDIGKDKQTTRCKVSQ